MKKFLFVLFLVLLAAVTYFGVNKFAPEIEANITQRVNQALNESLSDTNITAEVNGRDVTLRGNVQTADSREEAARVTGNVLGVRAVSNNINVSGVDMDVQQIQAENIAEEMPEEANSVADLSFNADEQTPDVVAPDITTTDIPVAEVSEDVSIDTSLDLDIPQPSPVAVVEEQQSVDAVLPNELPQPTEVTQPQEQEIELETFEAVEEEIQAPEGTAVTDACEEKLMALVNAEKINFDTGSATIQASSYPLLDKIVVEAKKCKGATIQVHGHTDSSGNKATNRLLSHARAKSVGRYMLTKGVAEEVRIFGHGANNPIADNATEEGRAKNRRIEFKVIKK